MRVIRNKSRIEKIVHLDILHDNGIRKKCTITNGVSLFLVFRRDGKVLKRYGIIKNILDGKFFSLKGRRNSGFIEFDSSSVYRSEKFTISLDDILDFTKIYPVKYIGVEHGKMPMKIIPNKCREVDIKYEDYSNHGYLLDKSENEFIPHNHVCGGKK